MEPINQFEPLMSMKEVGAYLSIHPMTAWRYARTGVIPAFRVGGRWRARRDKLDQSMKKESLDEKPNN